MLTAPIKIIPSFSPGVYLCGWRDVVANEIRLKSLAVRPFGHAVPVVVPSAFVAISVTNPRADIGSADSREGGRQLTRSWRRPGRRTQRSRGGRSQTCSNEEVSQLRAISARTHGDPAVRIGGGRTYSPICI